MYLYKIHLYHKYYKNHCIRKQIKERLVWKIKIRYYMEAYFMSEMLSFPKSPK